MDRSRFRGRRPSALVTFWVLSLPAPSIPTHGVEVVSGAPLEKLLSGRRIGVALRHIPRSARYDLVGNRPPAGPAEGLHHLEHRITAAGAEIHGQHPCMGVQVAQGCNVPEGQIHDMNVIAHPGAIRGLVISPKDA